MGLTRVRAEQISDIDYKQAVRVITLTNITLTIGAPSQVDSVNLSQGDRILVAGQSTGSENGIYRVDAVGTGSNGTWVRSDDANTTGEIQAGMIVMITEGIIWKDTSWKLTTNNPIVLGTTALSFIQNTGDSYSIIIANNTSIIANAVSSAITFTPGNNLSIVGNATSDTVTFAVADAPSFTTVTLGNIVNSNGNGVGNIGSSSLYFNTVFAQATSAVYADLAEMYCADNQYLPGTVMEFGGEKEVTSSTRSHSTAVAGIVSTHPSYLMNSTLDCVNALEIALVGRVPCFVVGTIRKGDRLVASPISGVAAALEKEKYEPGCIIGKSLEDYDSDTVGVIEVAVGRF